MTQDKDARIAELAAENERLRNMLNGYGKLDAELAIAERRIEALSRTGAVKVKALEWEKCQPGVYTSSSHSTKTEIGEYLAQSRAVYFRGNLIASASGLDAAKAAAQEDYKRRILSALEPAAPEGQQPVAWHFEHRDGDGNWEPMLTFSKPAKSSDIRCLEPLYTRPSEQAVTEAGKEVIRVFRYATMSSEQVRAYQALKAAMEAGR